MNFLFTPPNTHYDNGLGIPAHNFLNAANILKENNNTMAGVLPLYYLQRHSIELFLKSLIVCDCLIPWPATINGFFDFFNRLIILLILLTFKFLFLSPCF